MNRLLAVCGAFLLLIALSASQTSTPDENEVDLRPGLISPDGFLSPFWGFEIRADHTLSELGWHWNPASDIIHERASEAVVAAEANDTVAMERAVTEAQRMAQIAHGVNGDGLEDAETLLREVRDRTPSEAHTGLETAIDNVIEAQNRLPTDLPASPRVPDRINMGGVR